MKRIEAIIKEENLESVKSALDEAGFTGMTFFHCLGRGTSGGVNLEWRAGTYRVDFLEKIMLLIVVQDDQVEQVTDIIIRLCQNGDVTGGSGKIFISSIEQVIRVRTSEQNENAL